VPGYEADGWSGMSAPKNTPIEIVDTLNKEINAGLADPKMKARLSDWAARRLRDHLAISASSLPTKSTSGPR